MPKQPTKLVVRRTEPWTTPCNHFDVGGYIYDLDSDTPERYSRSAYAKLGRPAPPLKTGAAQTP